MLWHGLLLAVLARLRVRIRSKKQRLGKLAVWPEKECVESCRRRKAWL
jgi:hypothetical protein